MKMEIKMTACQNSTTVINNGFFQTTMATVIPNVNVALQTNTRPFICLVERERMSELYTSGHGIAKQLTVQLLPFSYKGKSHINSPIITTPVT